LIKVGSSLDKDDSTLSKAGRALSKLNPGRYEGNRTLIKVHPALIAFVARSSNGGPFLAGAVAALSEDEAMSARSEAASSKTVAAFV
jgi:hypothetical protein